MKTGPLAEVGGVAAKINRDVPDMAGKNSDEFALRLFELVMEATKDTLDRERLVILDELCRKTRCGKG